MHFFPFYELATFISVTVYSSNIAPCSSVLRANNMNYPVQPQTMSSSRSRFFSQHFLLLEKIFFFRSIVPQIKLELANISVSVFINIAPCSSVLENRANNLNHPVQLQANDLNPLSLLLATFFFRWQQFSLAVRTQNST